MTAAQVTEIHCKTLINRVNAPDFHFRWTINPYRGCRHACRYCYARSTHQYWGMDAGQDFESQIFAKVNAPSVLRQELSRPKWQGDPIVIGTASDPYEPAEAQYRLTRQVLEVMAEFRNPVSITTKGTLVRRDIDVLRHLNEVAGVQVVFSVGAIDETVWRQTEPGAPNPMARLEAMQYLVEHGIPAGVLAAPLLPGLSDSSASIDALVEAAAQHRAQFLSGNLLFLRPGSREWFMPMIRESYPHLAPGYARLYRSEHAPRDYTNAVVGLVEDARLRWELPRMPSVNSLQPAIISESDWFGEPSLALDFEPRTPVQMTLGMAA